MQVVEIGQSCFHVAQHLLQVSWSVWALLLGVPHTASGNMLRSLHWRNWRDVILDIFLHPKPVSKDSDAQGLYGGERGGWIAILLEWHLYTWCCWCHLWLHVLTSLLSCLFNHEPWASQLNVHLVYADGCEGRIARSRESSRLFTGLEQVFLGKEQDHLKLHLYTTSLLVWCVQIISGIAVEIPLNWLLSVSRRAVRRLAADLLPPISIHSWHFGNVRDGYITFITIDLQGRSWSSHSQFKSWINA